MPRTASWSPYAFRSPRTSIAAPVIIAPQGMRCACIDIGSNTTRLLVADVRAGRLEAVLTDKAYTRFGRELRRPGALPAGAAELAAGVVARQRAQALAAG